jgi:hypothetical protein
LEIPSARLRIRWEGATTWEAALPQGEALPSTERIQRFRGLAGQLLERKNRASQSPLLAGLLLLKEPAAAESRLPGDLRAIQRALAARDGGLLVAALDPFLGWGPGLTPSGDDLAAGLLLALSRWGKELYPGWKYSDAGAEIVKAAQLKTTTLSAALIVCAFQGQADERLVQALDGVLTGSPALERCAELLSSWGNTSGGDALVGMGLVVLGARMDPGEL